MVVFDVENFKISIIPVLWTARELKAVQSVVKSRKQTAFKVKLK